MKNFILMLRSLLFSVGMIIATVIHATLSLFTFVLPYRLRYRFITLWSRFIIFWLKWTCGISYRISGLEHLPKNSAAIVLSKHQSAWETFFYQVTLPPQTWVLKRELLWVPFFGWALALLEPIAINRSAGASAITQLVQQGKKRLDQGRWVVVFPEGTRLQPGETRAFAKGGALLAAKTGYPVVPIAHNAGHFWPRRGFLKIPGIVQVQIGPAIASEGKDANAINAEAKTWIDRAMEMLNPRGKESACD